jgi:hypothetical protein
MYGVPYRSWEGTPPIYGASVSLAFPRTCLRWCIGGVQTADVQQVIASAKRERLTSTFVAAARVALHGPHRPPRPDVPNAYGVFGSTTHTEIGLCCSGSLSICDSMSRTMQGLSVWPRKVFRYAKALYLEDLPYFPGVMQ